MIILGINAYHGDAAAVLVEDGKLVLAVEEERLNRIKHSAGLPASALKQCLRESGISLDDLDYVTISRSPTANLLPKLGFLMTGHPPLSFVMSRLSASMHSSNILDDLSSQTVVKSRTRITRVEHHLSHAASAFYPSGFERAALLTVDGFGDFSSVLFGIGEGNRIKLLKRILFPHSLGILYTAATQFLGFPNYGDEYKVMGLAGWGEPVFLKKFREIVQFKEDGTFELTLAYFRHQHGLVEMTWEGGEPVLGAAYSEEWENIFGRVRKPDDPLTQEDKDLAASLQAIFEEGLFHLLNSLYLETGLKTLCLAGGCAFNSVANGKIFDHTPFEKVYIQPAAGDAGTALGSALYLAHHRLNQPRQFVMDHAYWGPEFGKAEFNEELKMQNEKLKDSDCQIREMHDEDELCRETAKAIAEGKVVGWFQGRMEWGPRALGNRSILADPRQPEMRDILNARIKHREDFRPFAPSVLEEKASDWFEMKTSKSPFMNFVFPVRSGKKGQIPAVTHVDGTARVHTVSRSSHPLFWKLIHEFEKITGVPLLLNTSFNENEPIVCTPSDALASFLRTRMDTLVLGPYVIERQSP